MLRLSQLLLLGSCVALQPGAAAEVESFDLIIRGGQLYDGTGTPWLYQDVGIRGDRIAALGKLGASTAKKVIDAQGLSVTPGFIDVHSHAGPPLAKEDSGDGGPLLAQGITTVFVNPDGGGPTDLAAQRTLFAKQGVGVNVAQFIGHNSVRIAVLGYDDRAPTSVELGKMEELVRAAMQLGAFGLSAGPFYTPGNFSKTDEHIALARIAAKFDGVYASHIRDEGDYSVGLLASVDEVITVAREAHLTGIVTHIKALGPHSWGLSKAVIAAIDSARQAGIEVFADQYPYDASSISLGAALLPPWAQAGGAPALQGRLAETPTRERIRGEMISNLERRGGAHSILIPKYLADHAVEGKRLDEIAHDRGVEPVDAAIALIRAGGASIVSFNMSETDLTLFMAQPWTMTCSDGDPLTPMAHPRSFGSFARKLSRYTGKSGALTWEQAIHSMTGLPASVLRLADRGVLRVGAFADIVVCAPDRLHDNATYEEPTRASDGIIAVVVNGQLAYENGHVRPERSGRVLSRL